MTTANTLKDILSRHPQGAILMPGLSEEEIARFQRTIPGPLPDEIRELLRFSAGFRVEPLGSVHFTGTNGFELTEVFPIAVSLLADGSGNFWAVDINGDTGIWDAVFFISHDPPVVVIQAREIGVFLSQILDPQNNEPKNALDYVQKEAVTKVWKDDPWLIPADTEFEDPVVVAFARQLPKNFSVVDLRLRTVGSGFSWGSAGPNTEIRRCGSELLFGVEGKRQSFFKKIRARKKQQM